MSHHVFNSDAKCTPSLHITTCLILTLQSISVEAVGLACKLSRHQFRTEPHKLTSKVVSNKKQITDFAWHDATGRPHTGHIPPGIPSASLTNHSSPRHHVTRKKTHFIPKQKNLVPMCPRHPFQTFAVSVPTMYVRSGRKGARSAARQFFPHFPLLHKLHRVFCQ